MTQPPFKKTVWKTAIDSVAEHMIDSSAPTSEVGGAPRTLRFACSSEDIALCKEIAQRAVMEAQERQGVTLNLMGIFIDVATVHCNGHPMHLLQLLMSDPTDFAECIVGIGINLDRTNGELMNGWLPRFLVKQS